MGKESKIEWTEATWNPWYGCHKVSQGCKNCYMFRDTPRFGKDPNTVVRSKTTFNDPLKWKEPRRIFTCSWSDFFIEEADAWRDEAFAIMALTPQHTYQVLTKRPERMLEYLTGRPLGDQLSLQGRIALAMAKIAAGNRPLMETGDAITRSWSSFDWHLPNVWLGVSVEDQKTADERIPLLLQTPAAVRWLSVEPLLGPIDLTEVEVPRDLDQLRRPWDIEGYKFDCLQTHNEDRFHQPPSRIDWVVGGGESGPDARPMHPDWVRSIRDQCTAAGVPFFFKQWGEWANANDHADGKSYDAVGFFKNGTFGSVFLDPGPKGVLAKVGKKKAGRTLDGRTWNEVPEVSRDR